MNLHSSDFGSESIRRYSQRFKMLNGYELKISVCLDVVLIVW
jgi:hypothetical protein